MSQTSFKEHHIRTLNDGTGMGYTFFTEAGALAQHRKQDEALAKELQKHHTYVDSRFDKIDKRLDEVTEMIYEQRGYVDERFDKVDERFDKVDERFDKVDERFDQVDKRFDEQRGYMDQQFGDFKTALKRMDSLHQNKRSLLPRQSIQPIPVPHPTKGSLYPDTAAFPKTIHHFWRLQHPRRVNYLVHLIHFYDIQGYEHWGNNTYDPDASDDECEPTSGPSFALEEAVAKHPLIALETLASVLGLKWKHVKSNMVYFEKMARENPQASKRKPSSDPSTTSPTTKRPHKNVRRAVGSDQGLTFAEMIAQDEHEKKALASEISHPSERSARIGWARYDPKDPSFEPIVISKPPPKNVRYAPSSSSSSKSGSFTHRPKKTASTESAPGLVPSQQSVSKQQMDVNESERPPNAQDSASDADVSEVAVSEAAVSESESGWLKKGLVDVPKSIAEEDILPTQKLSTDANELYLRQCEAHEEAQRVEAELEHELKLQYKRRREEEFERELDREMKEHFG
ncbi:MAG: hypothetical protein M1814_005203 [Vezdaea aestivalis]|nr:MAG: hypothetical protein M1814_005203 [Vezdaea aestivalis]